MAVNKDMVVLIVDDYKTMLRILRNLLGQLGFNNVDRHLQDFRGFKMKTSARKSWGCPLNAN